MKTAALSHRSCMNASARQRGVVLIAALAVLLMLTLLSIGMFRSFGLEERITGNSREKQHAFNAAESSLQYAETWLSSNGGSTGQACGGVNAVTTICTSGSGSGEPLPYNFATQDWHTTYGSTYPMTQIVTSQTAGDQLAFASPQYAINYVGVDPSNSQNYLYQVTALGFGGNQNSMAVVQSIYTVGSAVNNGCPIC